MLKQIASKSPVSGRPICTYPAGSSNSERLPLAAAASSVHENRGGMRSCDKTRIACHSPATPLPIIRPHPYPCSAGAIVALAGQTAPRSFYLTVYALFTKLLRPGSTIEESLGGCHEKVVRDNRRVVAVIPMGGCAELPHAACSS